MTIKRGRVRTAFAIERGRKIRELRANNRWSQAKLAEELGLESREAVSQYESGNIKEISPPVARKLIALGLQAADLLEDPSTLDVQEKLPDVTPEARRIAYAWDALPGSLRGYLGEQVQAWQRLKKHSPVLAAMLSDVGADPKSIAQHERTMEEFTKRFIAETTKPERR